MRGCQFYCLLNKARTMCSLKFASGEFVREAFDRCFENLKKFIFRDFPVAIDIVQSEGNCWGIKVNPRVFACKLRDIEARLIGLGRARKVGSGLAPIHGHLIFSAVVALSQRNERALRNSWKFIFPSPLASNILKKRPSM